MSKKIHFISNDVGSLGEITNDLINYLKNYFIVTNEAENQIPKKFDILVSHFISEKVTLSSHFNSFRFRVLIQPIDGTKLKKNIIDSINRYDLIITPGKAGKKIMINNGVYKPIKVIPNYYKPEILSPVKNLSIPELDKLINDKFVFYHESTCHPRKGIKALCESFTRAFSSNTEHFPVVLLIKSSPHNEYTFDDLEKIKKDIIKLQKEYKYPAQIIKISQHLPFKTLEKIWHKIDAYVSFAGIEGFGIPLLRMALLEKPIVTLKSEISGYMDYLNNNSNTIFVNSVRGKAEKELTVIYESETEWEYPTSIEECKTALLETYFSPHNVNDFSREFLKKYSYKYIMEEYKNLFYNIEKYKIRNSSYSFIESDIEI